MITDICQRWTERVETRRPAGELIRTSEYDVISLGPLEAEAFVMQHHYSGACSPTMISYGLLRHGNLSGAAVFGPLPSKNAHQAVFPTLNATQAVTLGRLVLLDSVPGNGESYFVARCFDLLRARGAIAVESCADPQPRDVGGKRTHRGHVGTVYQATNGHYVGKTNPASLRLLPNGSVLSNRTQGKLVRGEAGKGTAVAQLVKFGATPLVADEDPHAWLKHWRAELTTGMRHYGNHRYLWSLDKRRRAEVLAKPRLAYPKMDLARAA